MKCIKFLLFAFNLIFVIAAIAIIAVGAYVQIKLTEYYDFFGNQYAGPGILLIVVGVFIFIIAFFGCMGAIKENYCLVMTFAVLLALIFILMIAGGIAGFVLRNDIEDKVVDVLKNEVTNYNKNPGVTDAWNVLQQEFQCCGVTNSSDWKQASDLNTTYPWSCCMDSEACKTKQNITYDDIYKQACESAFIGWMKDKVAIIGGVGIGLAFVMVVGVLFACCLARAIRKEYEVV